MKLLSKVKSYFYTQRTRGHVRAESGRSMVEMLGVLVIIGVITVGAMVGYRYAMERIITNSIITGIRARAVVIGQQRVLGQPLNLNEFHPDTEKDLIYGHFEVKVFEDYYEDGSGYQALKVYTIPKRVCEKIQDTEFPDDHITLVNGTEMGNTPLPCIPDGPTDDTGGITDAGDYFTAEYHNTVTFVFMNLEDAECESSDQCAPCQSCVDGICTPDENGMRCGGTAGGCCVGGRCLPPGSQECTCIVSYNDPTGKAYACCLQGYTEGTKEWTCCLNPNDLVCQPPVDKCAGVTCGDCMRCDSDTGTCVLDATQNGQACGSDECSVCENGTCQNKTTQRTLCNGTKENCCPLTATCTDETNCVKECTTNEDCGFCEACTDDGQCVSNGIEYITKCDGTQEACCTWGGMATCESPTDCRCAEGETWDDSPEAKASGKGTSEGACCPAEWTWNNGECCRTIQNHWTGKQTEGCCTSFGGTWYKTSDGTWSCCGVHGAGVWACPKCLNVTCPDCGKCDEKTGYCVTDEDQIGTPCGTTGCSVCDHGGACVDQRVEITTCNGDTKQCCPLNGNTCTNETNCPTDKCTTDTDCTSGCCCSDGTCSDTCCNKCQDVQCGVCEECNPSTGKCIDKHVDTLNCDGTTSKCCPLNGNTCEDETNCPITCAENEILCDGKCITGCCYSDLPKEGEDYYGCYTKCDDTTHQWTTEENVRWCPKSKTCAAGCCEMGISTCCQNAKLDVCIAPFAIYRCVNHTLLTISVGECTTVPQGYQPYYEWGSFTCVAPHKVQLSGKAFYESSSSTTGSNTCGGSGYNHDTSSQIVDDGSVEVPSLYR